MQFDMSLSSLIFGLVLIIGIGIFLFFLYYLTITLNKSHYKKIREFERFKKYTKRRLIFVMIVSIISFYLISRGIIGYTIFHWNLFLSIISILVGLLGVMSPFYVKRYVKSFYFKSLSGPYSIYEIIKTKYGEKIANSIFFIIGVIFLVIGIIYLIYIL